MRAQTTARPLGGAQGGRVVGNLGVALLVLARSALARGGVVVGPAALFAAVGTYWELVDNDHDLTFFLILSGMFFGRISREMR